MILHPSLLLPKQVKKIKALLYTGHKSQPEIATKYNTHQTAISRILNGHIWEEIEWPDGNPGRMDPDRHKVITSSRKRTCRYANKQKDWPSDETAKVLEEILGAIDPDMASRENDPTITGRRRKLETSLPIPRMWNTICEADPYHEIVRQLEGGEQNTSLKAAACLVLRDVPLNEWSRKSVIAVIHKLSHFIKNNP